MTELKLPDKNLLVSFFFFFFFFFFFVDFVDSILQLVLSAVWHLNTSPCTSDKCRSFVCFWLNIALAGARGVCKLHNCICDIIKPRLQYSFFVFFVSKGIFLDFDLFLRNHR